MTCYPICVSPSQVCHPESEVGHRSPPWGAKSSAKIWHRILLIGLLLAITMTAAPVGAQDIILSDRAANQSSISQARMFSLAIPFITNNGQQPDSVKFYANTFYGTAYITGTDLTHAVAVTKGNETYNVALKEQFITADGTAISMNPQGEDPAETRVSYFIGNDSRTWQTGLPTYNRVSLGELYPGIRVSTKVHGNNVEKLFMVAPGADPSDIRVKVCGADSIRIVDDGSLVIVTGDDEVIMAAPNAFQDDERVAVAYRVLGDETYGFVVGEYDPSRTLVIDPSLVYSTYIGGGLDDFGFGITRDAEGNVYITGATGSSDFPTTEGVYKTTLDSTEEGVQDAFVSKLNPAGTALLYTTYLGGVSYMTTATGIANDTSGNVYITGYTISPDFPHTAGAYQTAISGNPDDGLPDVFVSELNPSGTTLLYSTYLGGSDDDESNGIATDSAGNIFVTGYARSGDFPTTAGAYQTTKKGSSDAFVSKINPAGSGDDDLVYSTYLGEASGNTYSIGIALDNSGIIYISGATRSASFPTTSGAYQTTKTASQTSAFISKINPAGSGTNDLDYSTYIGNGATNSANGIVLDSSGMVYITGSTGSFPVTSGAYQTSPGGGGDAFVSKLNLAGDGADDLLYSTYLGGSDSENGKGIAVDNSGNVFITGYAGSGFPTTSDAYQPTWGGGTNAFVSKINTAGGGTSDLVYSTYLGNNDEDYGGNGITADNAGNVFITGYAGSGFPTTAGAYQPTFHGDPYTYDAFVTKLSFPSEHSLTSITLSPTTASLITGQSRQFTATANDQDGSPMSGILFTWSSDNETVGTVSSNGLFTATGVGAANISAVNGTVTGTAKVTVTPPAPDLSVVSITTGTPVVNHAGTVSVRVLNAGGAAAGKFNVTLLAGSTEVNRATVSSLGAAESADVSIAWTPSASGSVTLTAEVDPENAIGDADTTDNTVTKTVSVQAEVTSGPDLTVTREYSQNWVPYPNLFAHYTAGVGNKIGVMITNAGTGTAPAFNVTFRVDGNSTNVTVPAGLAAGSFTYVNITDTLERSPGATVPVNATVDSANEIPEISETNNEYSYTANVIWNGYNGRRWADGGPDIATRSVYPVNGNILYSNGDSTYRYVADTYYTHWTAADLPVPANATIESARLYATYTWDSGWLVPDHITMAFNGKTVPYEFWYSDNKNWGDIYNYPFGVLIYDVTDQFSAGGNTMAMDLVNRQSGQFVPFRGMTLVVVYNDPGESEKLIFLNEGFDIVFSSPKYYTTDETATAYAPFTGAEINLSRVENATVTTILNRGVSGSSRGAMLFNGQKWPDYWVKTTDAEIATNTTVVTEFLKETGNVAMFRSQATNNMDMEPYLAILNVEYDNQPTPPRSSFTANVTSGYAELAVAFRDRSSGTPTSWAWDFGDGSTSTEKNPVHTYGAAGTYTVRLTATNALGANTTVKNNDITATLGTPVAAFNATKTAGDTPFTAQFTDQSARLPSSWTWDFGDSDTTNATKQNPVHTYLSAGSYTVKLTAGNAAGSNTATRTGYINVNAKVIVEKEFNLAGVDTEEVGGSQNVSIDTSQVAVNTTPGSSVVTIEGIGNGWSRMDLTMNGTPEIGTSTVNGTITEVKAVGQNITVPMPSVGSPKVHLELALDELPDSGASITETITKDPTAGTTTSFTLAATTSGKNIDEIAYTVNFTKNGGIKNAGDGGIIRNATVFFAISPAWVAAHGGTSKIVIMHMNEAGLSTLLPTTYLGTDADGNDLFSAVSEEGLSTFALAAVSPASSGGSSGDSSGGSTGSSGSGTDSSSSGGSSSSVSSSSKTTTDKQKGQVFDYAQIAPPNANTVFRTTTVSAKGRVSVTPLIAETESMPGAKASWSAEIVNDPDGGGKISTGLISTIPETVIASYRTVLAGQGLDVSSVAYAMSVEKDDRIGATKEGVIEMTAPQKWVTDNGGINQIRVFRVSDEGIAELLTTAFSKYDMDTGYLTFRAESPNGLCTFTLLAVKPATGGSTASQEPGTAQVSGPTSSGDAGILNQVAPVGLDISYGVIIITAIMIIAGCIGLAVVYRMRKRDE